MRRILMAMISLASTSASALPSGHVAVPAAIVADLKESGVELEFDAAGKVTNLAAEPIELNGDAEPELEVHGLGRICGAANCDTWLYRKTRGGYELLLFAGAINRIEPQNSLTKGYRDIMAVMHGSAFESDLKLYKFDGHEYRKKSCFNRTYQVLDSQGNVQKLKKPKITRVKCGE